MIERNNLSGEGKTTTTLTTTIAATIGSYFSVSTTLKKSFLGDSSQQWNIKCNAQIKRNKQER